MPHFFVRRKNTVEHFLEASILRQGLTSRGEIIKSAISGRTVFRGYEIFAFVSKFVAIFVGGF